MLKDVLVVDDEPKVCRALKGFFERRGVRVATASTARACLKQVRQGPTEVVLLDLRLPDRSGLDVLSELKHQQPRLRVVVISALNDQDTIHEALQRGASDYLTKPFDFNRCFSAAMGEEVSPGERVIRFVNALIRHACANRASHLHLGINAQGPWIRERIDGVLSEVPVPSELAADYPGVVARLKILADLSLAQQLPQQGRAWCVIDGAKLMLRISVVPTPQGEHVGIRFLDPSRTLRLEQLGFSKEQLSRVAALVAKPAGLLLITGPKDAGKSTTLSALLAALNTGRLNIVSIEDLVEQDLPGVTQIEVRPHLGLTHAAALRSALRHDPDVVMVDEIRDEETARIAIRAALNGHLVVSTLPTADAAGGIVRLLDLGIEPFAVCAALWGVISQRLLRMLCERCRTSAEVDAAALASVLPAGAGAAGVMRVWHAQGCPRCRHTGYNGRTGVYELLPLDHQLRSLIFKRTAGAHIRQSAVSRGMTTLWQAGLRKMQAGLTSLEELVRVLPADEFRAGP